jgi:hypothetical protein
MQHPDLVIELARRRSMELHAAAAHRRIVRRPVRIGMRVRLGRSLVRWGERLARAPRVVTASPQLRRPATMGP